MPFELDLRTVSFLLSLFSMVFSICLLALQVQAKQWPEIKIVSLGFAIIAVANAFTSLRGYIPPWLSIYLANTLVCLGSSVIFYGYALLRKANLRSITKLIFFVPVVTFLLIYYTAFEPSTNTRVVIVSSYLAVTMLVAAWEIFHGNEQDNKLPVIVVSASLLFTALTMTTRAILVFNSRELQDYMAASWVHQIPFITSVFSIIALAFCLVWIINSRLVRSLENLSMRDSLTSLYNRRGLEKVARHLFENKQSNKHSTTVLMCDIDHFKSINDNFGHHVGDIVIQDVATLLKQHLRSSDIICRYGGEEFVVLLPNTDTNHAKDLAERVRVLIHNHRVKDYPSIIPSISIGVAKCTNSQTVNHLIGKADTALYQAKESGRNCIVYDEEFEFG